MSPLTQIALYGWPPIVVLLFREMKGYKAVAVSFIGALLFLPSTSIRLPGIPDLAKTSGTVYACVLATIIFHPLPLLKFRVRWFDIPMLVYCFSPIPSAVVNEIGVGHGMSLSIVAFAHWGMPYFIGRLYFTSFETIHFLAKAIFVSALIYIPFCLYELRMSPQLHRMVYGFFPGSWSVLRYGGFRPSVFMQHGLQLGLWMTVSLLVGYSLWRTKVVKKIYGFDIRLWLAVLFVVTVCCKSTGALMLLVVGFCAILEFRLIRSYFVTIALALTCVLYISLRASNTYDGSDLVKLTSRYINPQRASSLAFRFKNEDMLVAKALESPVFGWGGNGRNRVYNDYGKDVAITDGYWIITLGQFGFLGLCSVYLAFMLIPVLAAIKYRSRKWNSQDVGTTIAISIFLLLFMVDCLLNAMPAGIYPLSLGAISTIYGTSAKKLGRDSRQLTTQPVHQPEEPRRLWPPKRIEESQLAT